MKRRKKAAAMWDRLCKHAKANKRREEEKNSAKQATSQSEKEYMGRGKEEGKSRTIAYSVICGGEKYVSE